MHSARSTLLFAPVILLLAACESTAPHPMQRINLSATIGSAALRSSLSGPFADVIVSGTGGTVRITSAQLQLSHIKLASGDVTCTDDDANEADDANEQAGTSETEADDADEAECPPVRVEPVQVDLPLDGTTKVILDALVPAGTYRGLHAKLEGVKVVGVFTDAGATDHAFTFTSDVHAPIMLDFATPVTVDAHTTNLTIDVDVGSWFKDATGAVIDPTNSANQEAIEHAIRASLRAFRDDNHDGEDDHEEEGGEGH